MATPKLLGPSPGWARVEAALGAIGLDATWQAKWSLAGDVRWEELGVRISWAHRLTARTDGEPRSRWELAGVRTSLLPSGRTDLRWHPPGEAVNVSFTSSKIGRSLSDAGARGWLIRRAGEERFEIRHQDGRSWTYLRGALVEMEVPALGRMRVVTRGALILRIASAEDPNASPWLEANYDEAGSVRHLRLRGGAEYLWHWGSRGQLEQWERVNGAVICFRYEDSLVAAYRDGDGGWVDLKWRENPGWRRGDTKWPVGWNLIARGAERFEHSFESQGFVTRRSDTDGKAHWLRFNPRLGRIEVRDADGEIVVRLAKLDGAWRALLDVSDSDGQLLERYDRGMGGRLERVWRIGQGEAVLIYDQSGRLEAVREIQDR